MLKSVFRPEASLKRKSSTDIFLWILWNSVKFCESATADSSVPAVFIHQLHLFRFFLHFFKLWEFTPKGFEIIYPKINMLLRQFCLGNNLTMQIRENTDFPRQKPLQMPRQISKTELCTVSMSSLKKYPVYKTFQRIMLSWFFVFHKQAHSKKCDAFVYFILFSMHLFFISTFWSFPSKNLLLYQNLEIQPGRCLGKKECTIAIFKIFYSRSSLEVFTSTHFGHCGRRDFSSVLKLWNKIWRLKTPQQVLTWIFLKKSVPVNSF